MLEILVRVPAYDPDVVTRWAQDHLGVTDPTILAKIEKAYEFWYDSRQHDFEIKDKIPDYYANAAVRLDAGRQPWGPFYAIYTNTISGDVGFTSYDRPFGSNDIPSPVGMSYHRSYNTEEGDTKPHFENVDDWRKKLRSMRRDINDHAIHEFTDEVARIIGIRSDVGYWSWFDGPENYKKFVPIINHLQLVQRQKINKELKRFLAVLDPDAWKVLRKLGHFQSEAYEWLANHRISREARKRRREILLAYPALLYFVSGYSEEGRKFSREIDKGTSLREALEIGLNYKPKEEDRSHRYAPEPTRLEQPPIIISKEFLGWLHGKSLRDKKGEEEYNYPTSTAFHNVIPSLNAIPREWRPTNLAQFRTFFALWEAMDTYDARTGTSREKLIHDFIGAVRRPKSLPKGFMRLRRKNPQQYDMLKHIMDRQRIGSETHIHDFTNRALSQIAIPETIRLALEANVKLSALATRFDVPSLIAGAEQSYMFRDFGVVKLESLNKRWHRHAARLQTRVETTDADRVWVPLFDGSLPLAQGKAVAVNLCSSAAIRQEGQHMNHCVGGYAYQCTIGNSHIVALKSSTETWKTTMELEDYVTKKGVRQVKILQHRGVGNTSSLPPVAHQAAAEIVDIINARAIDYTAIDNAREEARKNIMMIKIGFDPREDKACDEAYGAWHGTFRDLFPDATRDAYMERTGLRAALRRRIQTMYNRF